MDMYSVLIRVEEGAKLCMFRWH